MRKHRLAVAAAAVVALLAPALAPVDAAVAADLSKFQAGNIISDAVFYDSGAMSAGAVQSFLASKGASCTSTSSATCLKDYRETTPTRPADAYCRGTYTGATNETAAEIIVKAAVACGINPRVLLVTLQKEQSLVAATSPKSAATYARALGFGCPDNAGGVCDPQYAGFANQVYSAARQFQRYTAGVAGSYRAGVVNSILYHPNTACGRSSVLIQNQATANLYNYTPYQPNAAALAAGYGTGDSCSSYGNRNFWNFFTDWFGSTLTGGAPVDTVASGSKDVTGDGLGDAVLNAAGSLGVAPGATSPVSGTVSAGVTPVTSLTLVNGVGDWDGDGRADLIGRAASGDLMLASGTGNGAAPHATPRRIGNGWQGFTKVFGIGDWDGDGAADLAAITAKGDLMLYPGNGTGGFKVAGIRVIGTGWQGFSFVTGVGDFDGDAHTDVLAVSPNGEAWLYPGTGQGKWLARSRVATGWTGLTAVIGSGTFSTGTLPTIVARQSNGQMRTHIGNGKGALVATHVWGSGWGGVPQIVVTGDVTGDGKADVVTVNAKSVLAIYPGTNATYTGGATLTAPPAGTTWNLINTAGDFLGIGRAQVLARTANGELWAYPVDASGAAVLAEGRRIGVGWGGMTQIAGVGDWNGDGFADVLCISSATGELLLYSGNGSGGWIVTGQVVDTGWQGRDLLTPAGDVDGDKRVDVIARNPNGTLWLYRSDGTGYVAGSKQIGQGWQAMSWLTALNRTNASGTLELIARHSNGTDLLYTFTRGAVTAATVIGNLHGVPLP